MGEGDGGTINIQADSVTLSNGSGLNSGLFSSGVGDAGDININAGSLSLTSGALLTSSVAGQGNAGNVSIFAKEISIDGENTIIGGQVIPGATGDATRIAITGETISITNGGQIASGVFGGTGNSGSIEINATTLVMSDGGAIISSPIGVRDNLGQGNPGSIKVIADVINISGESSGIGSQILTGAVGNGGNITITTRILSLSNGADLTTSTGGQGNAGTVTITADTVSFDGESSGAYSRVGVDGVGDGGQVTINADRLSLTNGGALSTRTRGQGNAGNIEVNVNHLEVMSGSLVQTATSTNGSAGNIAIQARDSVTLSGANTGLFANTEVSSTGNGGMIALTTPILNLANGATVSARSQGIGTAGNINNDNCQIAFWASLESGIEGIYRANPGKGQCQTNPLMPDAIHDPGEDGRLYSFINAPGRRWYDPPSATGFRYQMTGDSLFTEVLNVPNGFDNLFTIAVGDTILGEFLPGDKIDFVSLFGKGVQEFTVTGINVNPTNPAVFPIKLDFNTATATFDMYAIDYKNSSEKVPEPNSVLSLFALGTAGAIATLKRKARSLDSSS